MQIIPAIDLKGGECVRLKLGDFDQATVYGSDPLKVLSEFHDHGADYVHVVDLDGAKSPETRQVALLERLMGRGQAQIQTGGGVRSADDVEQLLGLGAERVVIGSVAIRARELVATWGEQFGAERITLALDVDASGDGAPKLKTQGWQNDAEGSLDELLEYYAERGLRTILCTDISRDGVLTGPNVELYQDLIQRFPSLVFQASGGVSSLDDLARLAEAGAQAVIVGRALYEGKFSLSEAIAHVQ